jgi:hypothetical protein
LKLNKHCPLCKVAVNAKPNRNIIIDNVVETIVKHLPEIFFNERNKKIEEHKKLENESLQKLNKLVETATKSKSQFLDIQNTWTMKQRDIFQKGVTKFVGIAKIKYCELTGFTATWLKTASYSQLAKACVNIGVSIPENSLGVKSQNAQDLREKLETFLENLLF